jgi:hypothetical protein
MPVFEIAHKTLVTAVSYQQLLLPVHPDLFAP